ncbi:MULTISPECIES: hypothetical protein [Streptomyces]|uniref:hypothetical protein n=1 Tax=Streptomyces TaxID=1883 RepID=UPI0016748327|nr:MULTISPECIES: hypothetical protein [Streptomyces]MBK3524878.1 hypothetical protein [Streptomyces sp. MBT70]GGR70765.1 hypothetical protein GCM10010236_26210 [Streptomyces eurythermus]
MTREERRALLGDDVIAHIHERVAEAPEPSDEVVEKLRRIMTRPGHHTLNPPLAARAA